MFAKVVTYLQGTTLLENKVEKLSAFLDSGKEKKREEKLIKEESKKEISLYKYN